MRVPPIYRKTIITIAGRPGSGKSTTAKAVAQKLGYEHFSSGDLFREMVHSLGLDLASGSLHAEQNSQIDLAVDQKLRDIGESSEKLVIDSRMAWHWMPQSFRVFLDLDSAVAAKRIINEMDEERRRVEKIGEDASHYATQLDERLASEARRYATLYGVNPYVRDHYDLVINTEHVSPNEAAEQVVAAFKRWIA